MAKKSSASSRPVRLKSMRSEDIKNRQWTERERQALRSIARRQAAGDESRINFEDVPAEVVEEARKAILEDASMKRVPESKREEVINNKLKKVLSEKVLMMQPWIKDETIIVGDLVKKAIAETGENIILRRFSRFALGEEEM